MKILGIIFTVLLITIALLAAGLQLFLTRGLTAALNQNVFPAVKAMYGLDMSITNASVNLLKGTAELDGFTVCNLKGYSEPYLLTFDKCRIEVEMMSLLKRNPVVIKLAAAEGAVLVIEQNRAEMLNVKELADALKPVESTVPSAPQTPKQTAQIPQQQTPSPQTTVPAEPAAGQGKQMPVHIRRIAADVLVKCINIEYLGNADLKLRLTGSDLFTVPAESQPDSLLVLRGSLKDDKEIFATDLNAILEPLTDPQNPTFNATGSVLDMKISGLDKLLKKNDMEGGSFSVKPSITCTKGQLKGSRIDLVLNNLKIYGTDIGDTTLKLPVTGTLQHPVLDLTGALQSLFSEQAVKIGKAVGLKELKKELGKQLGVDTNGTPQEMLVSGLTNNVKELSGSPALQELIQQVVPGNQTNSAATNKPLGEAVGNALAEQLGKNVKELEGNEAVKETLKSLGNSLFGK